MLHYEGMYIMVDIIINHAAPISYHNLRPFDNHEYYHDFCKISELDKELLNHETLENCW